MLEGSLH